MNLVLVTSWIENKINNYLLSKYNNFRNKKYEIEWFIKLLVIVELQNENNDNIIIFLISYRD